MIMIQQQQQTTAPPSQPINYPSSSSLRSPTNATPTSNSHPPAPISLRTHSGSHRPHNPDHVIGSVVPIAAVLTSGEMMIAPLARVRLSDVVPYDGAPSEPYVKAVEALSGSLMRHNAAVIVLGTEDAAIMRCGLESARLYFRTRGQSGGTASWAKGTRGVYMYRAGRYQL
ncbi:unnamed protein product [Ilex paraguariensis]|uniref:Uncharacterized protein n=1 Tax=Ilex paraguariensis TaxID=185542 RepID=A0ABC8T0C0_9AQUA